MTVDEHLSGVRLLYAGHDLDERRLPGAVLAEERVDLAGVQSERDVVERLDGAESLRDAADLQDLSHRSPSRDLDAVEPLGVAVQQLLLILTAETRGRQDRAVGVDLTEVRAEEDVDGP